MKQATWMTTMVVGLVACSGTYVGGDLGRGGTSPGGASGAAAEPTGAGGRDHVSAGAQGSEHVSGGAGSSDPSNVSYGGAGGAASWRDMAPACTSTVDAWIVFDAAPQDPQPSPNAGAGGGFGVDGNRDLYAMRPDGTQLTRLTSNIGFDWQASFSPDGSALTFASAREGGSDIYVMNRAQHSVTKVTQRGDAERPSFSPNGRLLTFVSAHSVYTIKLDGSQETLIGPGENSRFISNDEIAIGQDANGTNIQPGGIKLVRLDGTESSLLVVGGEGGAPGTTQPVAIRSVSPAGDQIAYVTECGPTSRLSILAAPITGTTQACSGQPLAPAGEWQSYDDFASWGPNNAIVYANTYAFLDGSRVVLTGPDLSRCMVTEANLNAANPVWAPAGWQP